VTVAGEHIIDLIAIGLGGLPFLYLISRVITKTIWPEMRPQLPPISIYGEIVELPAAAKAGGAARGSSRGRTDDIAHRGKASTR
jgi:hypothetical protein